MADDGRAGFRQQLMLFIPLIVTSGLLLLLLLLLLVLLLVLLQSSLLLAMQNFQQLMACGIFARFRLLCRALGSLCGALLSMRKEQGNNLAVLRTSSKV